MSDDYITIVLADKCDVCLGRESGKHPKMCPLHACRALVALMGKGAEEAGKRSGACPECGGLLRHAGMGIPVYDCVECEAEWLIAKGEKPTRVTDGCPDECARG